MDVALLSVREAGRFLGYGGKTFGKSSVFKKLKEGELVRVRIGGRTFVTRESVDQLISLCTARCSEPRVSLAEGERCNGE